MRFFGTYDVQNARRYKADRAIRQRGEPRMVFVRWPRRLEDTGEWVWLEKVWRSGRWFASSGNYWGTRFFETFEEARDCNSGEQ
jgi:hypothetical protein